MEQCHNSNRNIIDSDQYHTDFRFQFNKMMQFWSPFKTKWCLFLLLLPYVSELWPFQQKRDILSLFYLDYLQRPAEKVNLSSNSRVKKNIIEELLKHKQVVVCRIHVCFFWGGCLVGSHWPTDIISTFIAVTPLWEMSTTFTVICTNHIFCYTFCSVNFYLYISDVQMLTTHHVLHVERTVLRWFYIFNLNSAQLV